MSGARNDEGFWKAWEDGEPAGDRLDMGFRQALAFFGLEDSWWEVRLATEDSAFSNEGEFMAVLSSDGNEAFFIVSDWLVNLTCRSKGRLVAATIIHEVLEMFEWPASQIEAVTDGGESLLPVRAIRHHQLDKLAWALVPHVFPNLNPEMEWFDEATDDGAGRTSSDFDRSGGGSGTG